MAPADTYPKTLHNTDSCRSGPGHPYTLQLGVLPACHFLVSPPPPASLPANCSVWGVSYPPHVDWGPGHPAGGPMDPLMPAGGPHLPPGPPKGPGHPSGSHMDPWTPDASPTARGEDNVPDQGHICSVGEAESRAGDALLGRSPGRGGFSLPGGKCTRLEGYPTHSLWADICQCQVSGPMARPHPTEWPECKKPRMLTGI